MILRKIFSWIFQKEIWNLEQYQERLKEREDYMKTLESKWEWELLEFRKKSKNLERLLGNIDVSVDVHHRSSSWAVVSLQGGNMDYIKFVDLGGKDIKEILDFLRLFERQNIKIDADRPTREMMMGFIEMGKVGKNNKGLYR